MAGADPAFEYLQRIQSTMESFDESLSQLCKDTLSDSARNLRKNLMESYHDLYKTLQSRYETLKIKEKKLEEPVTTGKSEENKTSKLTSSLGLPSEIEILYDKADGRGLRNYIMKHIKDVKILRNELMALLKAPDAAKLVLTALEPPFFPNKKASILLFECLYLIFGNDDSCVFTSDVKDSAQKIAKAWKKEMNMENTTRASRVNIMTFLKFLASFRIAADYERDELWRLLFSVSRNDETVEVCRSLGLSPNISEFIDMLSKGGKQLEVLRYADAFGMLDKVDHVELLTSYLRDVENAGKEVATNGQGTAAAQEPDYMAKLQTDAAIKLRAALRAVINLASKYGLKSHFFEEKLRNLEQGKEEKEDGNKAAKKKAENVEEKEDGKKASEKKAQEIEEREDRKNAAEKEAQEIEEKEDGKKAAEKRAHEKEERGGKKDAEKKAQEKEDGNKVAGKKALEKDGKKDAERKAQDKEDGNILAGKKAWEKDGKKDAGKKAQEKAGKKDAEKKAQEKEEQEDGKKDDAEKKAQHKRRQSFELGHKPSESENYASKRAKHASSNETTRVVKQKAEQEYGKKASEIKALEKEDGKNAAEKNAQENEDGKKAAEKKAQVNEEREVGKEAAENKAQHKRHQSFEPGYGLSERENYASKRAKDASLNETTRVVGMDNSKPSPYNIDGVQYNYGLIGHHHHPSASSAANAVLAAGAFASVPSIGAQINNERRRHEGNPLAFGTSNLTPIGSSLYSASVLAGPFAAPLSNVAAVNYDGRGQQSYAMNFVEFDKNHVRTSVYGTRDLSNSFAMQNNYNFEGRGEESYKLNFGEIHNNPVRASSHVTGVSANSSATECDYERRVTELYTSAFGRGNTAGIGSSVYGSNPCTIPSGVNQGSHERSLGQSSGFAGRNAVPPSSVTTTVPLSSVSQGHVERRGSVISKYTFNSG